MLHLPDNGIARLSPVGTVGINDFERGTRNPMHTRLASTGLCCTKIKAFRGVRVRWVLYARPCCQICTIVSVFRETASVNCESTYLAVEQLGAQLPQQKQQQNSVFSYLYPWAQIEPGWDALCRRGASLSAGVGHPQPSRSNGDPCLASFGLRNGS